MTTRKRVPESKPDLSIRVFWMTLHLQDRRDGSREHSKPNGVRVVRALERQRRALGKPPIFTNGVNQIGKGHRSIHCTTFRTPSFTSLWERFNANDPPRRY
jgi:hypothetical protein